MFVGIVVSGLPVIIIVSAVIWSVGIASVVFEIFMVVFKVVVGCVVIVSGLKRRILQKASGLKENVGK